MMWNHMLMIDQKRSVFKLRKLIEEKKQNKTKQVIDQNYASLLNFDEQILIHEYISLFLPKCACQIEKTPVGVKCGVEDLALLSVYPSPFRYLRPVSPN